MTTLFIGLRGAGKTTLGRLLAGSLSQAFTDLDDLTLAALGEETVADAWNIHGESRFRETEAELLRTALSQGKPGVLALGGGTPTAPGAADAIRVAQSEGRCHVIYLRAEPDVLASRLKSEDANRPSLTGADPIEEVAEIFRRRDPLYRLLADVEIDAAQPIEDLIRQIAGLQE